MYYGKTPLHSPEKYAATRLNGLAAEIDSAADTD